MKYIFSFALLLCTFFAGAQEKASQLQQNAQVLVQKGDFDNAIIILERASKLEPDNVDVLRDLCFAAYLKRDFAKAIEVGKNLVEKPNADQQSFQVLGLAYKATAAYKEAGKLYRTALRKFPNSGVIHNEYGEIFAADNEMDEAINEWEKGIETDPNYSGNYYNASIYYARKSQWLRAALYGELFLNLESYTTRVADIKTQMVSAWKALTAAGAIQQLNSNKQTTAFERSVLESLSKAMASVKSVTGLDDLITVRTKFVEDWMNTKQKNTPFHLFDHQDYLVKQNLFTAYNYWLFSVAIGEMGYDSWKQSHAKDAEAFTSFQGSRVFKVPEGQYYFVK